MKIPKLFDSYIPSRCCGAETLALAAVGAATGLISTAVASDTNDKNISNQRGENQKNRDFASAEAEKQRQWSAGEWSRQYELQRQEWYRQLQSQYGAQWEQFQKQAEYNAPVNQMQRLRAAGLNPSAMLGNQNSGLVSAATGNLSSPGTPSVPSGGPVSGASASAPSGQISPVPSPLMMGEFGSLVRDLASASSTSMSARANLENVLADTQLKMADKNLKDLAGQFQDLQLSIKRATKDADIQQAFANLGLSFLDQKLKASQTKDFDAHALFLEAETALSKLKGKVEDKTYEKIAFEVAHLEDYLALYKKQIDGQYAANMGSAALSNANAETVNRLRNYVVENAKHLSSQSDALAKLSENDLYVSNATLLHRVDAQISELQRAGIITSEQEQQLKRMRNDNKIYWYRQFLETTKMAKDMVPGTASDAMLLRLLIP